MGLWSRSEITMIFPNYKLEQTKLILEKAFKEIMRLPLFAEEKKRWFNAGVVAFPDHGKKLDLLVKTAQEMNEQALKEGAWEVGFAPPLHREHSLKDKQIVLIDPDENIRNVIIHAALERDMEIETFNNGESFLEWFKKSHVKHPPDVIILDWLLPGMLGIDVLVQIKELVGNSIPVIFLSQLRQEENNLEALRKGAVEYLTKPFRLGILFEKIRDHLK